MMKVIEMTVNGKKGYYTGLQSTSQVKTKCGCWINGFRITDRLEKIPKSGRFFYESREWFYGYGKEERVSFKPKWWATEGNELRDIVELLKDYSKYFKITGIKVVDVKLVPEKLVLTKSK